LLVRGRSRLIPPVLVRVVLLPFAGAGHRRQQGGEGEGGGETAQHGGSLRNAPRACGRSARPNPRKAQAVPHRSRLILLKIKPPDRVPERHSVTRFHPTRTAASANGPR